MIKKVRSTSWLSSDRGLSKGSSKRRYLDALASIIDVDKSASHHLSQSEIASDNPCYQHLSSKQFAVAGSITVIDRSLFLDCSFDQ